jgi:hypothetical protein
MRASLEAGGNDEQARVRHRIKALPTPAKAADPIDAPAINR